MTESIYESLETAHLNLLSAKGYQWLLFKDPIQPGSFGEIPTYHPHFIFVEVEPLTRLPHEMKTDWYTLEVSGASTKNLIRDDVYWYVVKTQFLKR